MPRVTASSKKRGLLFLLIFISFLFYLSSTARSQEEAKGGNDYAGDEACTACHDDLSQAFHKTVHGGKAFQTRAAHGCETCHGPGTAHIESGGETPMPNKFSSMKPSEASQICLQCHEKGMQTHWRGGVHDQRGLGCVSCHSVHKFKSETAQLKASNANEQCGTCHQNIKAQIMRTSHHPIREGLMSCASCHNPHGTLTPKMIIANSVNEQCYTCHAEKRGPFLWEHPPVKENCLNCHNPHGSNHPKLMVQKRPFICQNCHLDTRHPGTLYDGSPGSLASNRDFSRSCSNCHLTIHGSNHPSGWTFTR
jgi:DmsE family decaheme c-type cytochrome